MPSGLRLSQWRGLITDDSEVVEWAHYGIPLVFSHLGAPPAYCGIDYPSAASNKRVLDDDLAFLLVNGLAEGPLSPEESAVTCVSPRAAVPKPNSAKFRIIINPYGVNPFLADLPLALPSVRDVLDELVLLGPDAHMAKRDLANGFMQLPLAPAHRKFFGFAWRGNVYRYTRLVFGSKQSPARFCRFSKAINRLFRREGMRSRVYIDDFIFLAPSRAQCERDLARSGELLDTLGVMCNEDKTIHPTQVIEFLGIGIDVPRQRLFIPPTKLERMRPLLLALRNLHVVLWQDLASITGKLAHCASVSLCLRPFLKGFWQALYSLPDGHAPHAYVRLDDSFP